MFMDVFVPAYPDCGCLSGLVCRKVRRDGNVVRESAVSSRRTGTIARCGSSPFLRGNGFRVCRMAGTFCVRGHPSNTVVSDPRPRECRSSGVCVMYGKYRRGRECLPSVKNAAEPHAPVEPWSGACGPEDGKPLLFPRPGGTVGVRSLRGTCGRGGFRAAAGRFCDNEAVGQASEIENHPCRSFSDRGEIVGPHLSDGLVVSSFGGAEAFRPSVRVRPVLRQG